MNVIVNNFLFKVKVCSTPSSIMNGMMKKTFDGTYNGMLFFMPEKTEQSFWMYNCLIPLDIIFIDDSTITEIHSNCQPCNDKNNCENYKGYGDMVLELPGGYCEKYGIKKGDNVSFPLN